MRKRIISILLCLLIITLQFITTGNTVFAAGELGVSTWAESDTAATINNTIYVSPMGFFSIRYDLQNTSEYELKDIQIFEKRPGGSEDAILKNGKLSRGEKLSHIGPRYRTDPNSNPNVVQFRILYTVQMEDREQVVELTGHSEVPIIQVNFEVNYTSNVEGTVFKGEPAQLTAEVKSLSSLPIYNITVFDTDLGEQIGVIDAITPNGTATVKTTIPIEKSTNGNLVIIYDDPLGTGQPLEKHVKGNLQIQVRDEEPVSSLELNGKADKTKIPGTSKVNFELTVKNTGNTVLRELKCLDWDGKEFHTKESLQPGEEIKVTYTAEVKPDTDYELLVQGRVDNSNQLIKSTWSARLEKLNPQVEVQRTVSGDSLQPGEPFVLNYVVRNTGNVDLIDVVIEESAFGEITRLDSISAGKSAEFNKELVLEQDTYSKTILTARDAETEREYVYESAEMEFSSGELQEDLPSQDLSILLQADKESLNKPGKVELECIVKNTGKEPIYNLVFTLMDREIIIDNISILEPGEDKTILIPALQIDETETFVVEAKGIGADGEEFTAASQPLTIEIGESGLSGKFNILRVVLIIIILICVLVIGVLVYTLRGSGSLKLPFRRKRKPAQNR
jgi:hypothetical protein